MGQIKRQLAIWGAIAATTAVLPGLALADNASPDFGHHGRDHGRANTKLAVAGRAASRAEKEAYGMEIRGRSGDKPTDASGMVRFAHRTAGGAGEGLVGHISCLSKDQAGVVTVTGTIKRGGTRAAKGDKGKGLKPGSETTAANDDGTAVLDELAPWDDTDTADLAAADDASTDSADAVAAPQDHGKRGGQLAGKDFAFTIDVPGQPQHFSQPKIADKGTLAACSGGGNPVEVTRGGFRTRDASSAKDGDGQDRRGDHRHGWRR